jgi:CCR4-NOT transcriptional regulation complex NOT5 subunit
MKKTLTPDQVESRKERAVRFTRDVLDDPDRADEIEDETLEDYAERHGFQERKLDFTAVHRIPNVGYQTIVCILGGWAEFIGAS